MGGRGKSAWAVLAWFGNGNGLLAPCTLLGGLAVLAVWCLIAVWWNLVVKLWGSLRLVGLVVGVSQLGRFWPGLEMGMACWLHAHFLAVWRSGGACGVVSDRRLVESGGQIVGIASSCGSGGRGKSAWAILVWFGDGDAAHGSP